MSMLACLPLFSATVSGFITEQESGEPLQFVNVKVVGTKTGGQTNKKGYYVYNITEPGNYSLDVSLVSYARERIPFVIRDKNDAVIVSVQLRKEAIELNKVVVTAESEKIQNGLEIHTSSVHQGRTDIQSVVSPVEADVFRAVLTLPGVAPISDFSSGLYVRGGSPDQNLILLDDIDVYNPNHFGGIFSTFNTDAVESVNLIKGGYPARYGGRMSSVLDVTNRQGNRRRFSGVARTSLISTSATLEGPWKLGNTGGSYMASFRRTYVELIKQVYDELPDYYFYNGHAKFNWDIGNNDKISLSAYFGQDKLDFDLGSVLAVDWGNRTATAQWMHLFSPTLFSQFIFAGSEFTSNFSQISETGEEILARHNGIQDVSTKGILNWKPSNTHEVESGYEVKWNDTWLNIETSYQVEQSMLPDIKVSSLTSSAYVQDSWQIHPLLTLQPGLRLNWYRTLDTSPSQIPPASYVNLEPRLSLRCKPDIGKSVYLNFGAYHQYLTLMSMDVSTPFDVWFPLDGSLKPGLSLHYILGYSQDIAEGFTGEIEAYYKTYDNLLQNNASSSSTWNNDTGVLADIFHVGSGWTYGTDLLLRNDWRGLQGFVGCTLSQTKRLIEGVNIDPETNEAEPFYPRYDRSLAISVVETYNLSQNTGFQILGSDVKLGMNFSYNSGQPTDVPERIYFDGENFQLIYSYKDRVRLPAYIRLDLSTKYEWITRWGSIEPYLEVINVFNRKNVSFRNYSLDVQDNGTMQLQYRDASQFPFLPFVGLNVKW
jgi:hypothetical protein